MKKLLILVAALGGVLTACGGGSTPAAPSVTGTWDGTLAVQGTSFAALTSTLNQTNTPNGGDYSGSLILTAGGKTSANVAVSGNSSSGTYNIIASDGSILCNGTFSNGNRYSGTCAFNYEGSSQTLTIAMTRR